MRQELKKLIQEDPSTTWDIIMYPEHEYSKEGVLIHTREVPYLYTKLGYFVGTTIIHKKIIKSYQIPVLDKEGKQIIHPNLIHIQNTIDECLIQNISLFNTEIDVESRQIPVKGEEYKVVDSIGEREELYKSLTKEINEKKIPYNTFTRFLAREKGVSDITKIESEDLKEIIEKVKKLSDAQVEKIVRNL